MKTNGQAGRRRRHIVWIAVAFGCLFTGLIGGAVLYAWRPELTWVAPTAGFVAYVLAFRRGMLFWNPHLDATWRHGAGSKPIEKPSSEDPEKTLKLVRPQPTSDRSELRVVR